MANTITAGNASNNGTVIASDTTGVLNVLTGTGAGTSAVYVDASQNVGVGTTSPSTYAKLAVVAPTGQYAAGYSVPSTSGSYYHTAFYNNTTQIGYLYSDGTYFGVAATGASAGILFLANGSERMRIDPSGNLLVNTTTAAGVLSVKQSGATVYSNCLSLIDNASSNKWGILVDSGTTRLYFGYNAVSKSYIDQITGSYVAVSDSRLKENVAPLSLGLAEILRLNPVTYNFKSDEKKSNQIGLIAQEVLPIIPEAVGVPADDTEGSYGLNYAGLVPVLIKALQELKAELDAVKEKVGA